MYHSGLNLTYDHGKVFDVTILWRHRTPKVEYIDNGIVIFSFNIHFGTNKYKNQTLSFYLFTIINYNRNWKNINETTISCIVF